MSLLKKRTLVGLFLFVYSCQYDGNTRVLPGQGEPLYYFSEETQAYTEVHFLEKGVVVFNEGGYVDLGSYELLDSAVVSDTRFDTLAYLNTDGSWIFLVEERPAKLKTIHELLMPGKVYNSKDSLLEGYEWRTAIYKMRLAEDTVIKINFR